MIQAMEIRFLGGTSGLWERRHLGGRIVGILPTTKICNRLSRMCEGSFTSGRGYTSAAENRATPLGPKVQGDALLTGVKVEERKALFDDGGRRSQRVPGDERYRPVERLEEVAKHLVVGRVEFPARLRVR